MVNIIGLINEVKQHLAQWLPEWVTIFEWVNHLGINLPTWSTQPYIPPGQ